MKTADLECLQNFILNDEQWMWDEWNFFFYLKQVFNFFKSHDEKVKALAGTVDVICALGKSGLVFSTYIARITNKPLVVFSIGEFMSDGSYVIGFPEDDKKKVSGKKLLVVDSHTRSGKTLELIEYYLKELNIISVCQVVVDCRDKTVRAQMSNISVSCLEDFFNDFKEKVVEVISDSSLLSNSNFWMKDEEYWLGRKAVAVEPMSADQNRFEKIKKSILRVEIGHFLRGALFFTPMSIYFDVSFFSYLSDAFVGHIKKKLLSAGGDVKGVLFVPLTIAAVPMAVSLAKELYLSSQFNINLLYPLFRSENYYKKMIKQCEDYEIFLIDDVVTTGGLLKAFYDDFLGDEMLVNVLALYRQEVAVVDEYQYSRYFYDVATKVADGGGLVVIGNISNNIQTNSN